jgi:putative hydrolase of HD superfamily
MAATFEYLEHVNVLKRLPRTGWLLNGVTPCETVADHSCAVALLAIALAEAVNEDWAAEGLVRPLDVGQIVTIAVVHDLAEGLLTDLPKRARVRDVRQGPDGALYLLIDEPLSGQLLKLVPPQASTSGAQ